MSTVETATRLMTADEFYDFVHRPENSNRWFELDRGEVIELPPPTKPHGFLCIRVGSKLDAYAAQRKKGYVTSNDSGVIVEREPDTVRGPDIAFYEDAATFDELHPKYGEVPPRLAVEVLSPDDRFVRVMRKIMEFLKSGVGMVWIIDPGYRTVTVYRADKPPTTFGEDQEVTGEDILPGLRIAVSELFRLPGEQPNPPPTP
jgi:Uma2 family endonuclease